MPFCTSTSSALTLLDWLALLEKRHVRTIDMGLERTMQVRQKLNLAFSCPVIMVAGTNGKGSVCAMLESIFLQAGYRVGLYSKPHFLAFNERARINGCPVTDALLVENFEAVETQRKVALVSLSYFEFTSLAIMRLLATARLDLVILEVGLGGRLDAVNVLDADVAIVTSIDIDHADYLGDTREKIAFEKAGIFRAGKTAICGDPAPPQSLITYAQNVGADLWLSGRDFHYSGNRQQWSFKGRQQQRAGLNYPNLRGANQLLNAAATLAAVEALREHLPVSAQEVRNGLALVDLAARFQVLPGRPVVILDVAHNPHAAAALAQNLDNMGFYQSTYAVFGVMQDKDIAGIIEQLKGRIDYWCLTSLPLERAAVAEQLREILQKTLVTEEKDKNSAKNREADGAMSRSAALAPSASVMAFSSPTDAYFHALNHAKEDDRIVVFGSFLTVAGVMSARAARE